VALLVQIKTIRFQGASLMVLVFTKHPSMCQKAFQACSVLCDGPTGLRCQQVLLILNWLTNTSVILVWTLHEGKRLNFNNFSLSMLDGVGGVAGINNDWGVFDNPPVIYKGVVR